MPWFGINSLPSLGTYCTFSFGLFIAAVYYAHELSHSRFLDSSSNCNMNDSSKHCNNVSVADRTLMLPWTQTASVMFEEIWCVWVVVNMAYCTLLLMAKLVQRVVFGELRVSEEQRLKDKFWNFLFYKFIFIFGVLNVQKLSEVGLWCAWFSLVGFLHFFTQLCRDRFDYLTFSSTFNTATHGRVLILLLGILGSCFGLIGISYRVGLEVGLNTFAFMVVECILLVLNTLNCLIRYGIHLWDIGHEGVWENRGTYLYYTELIIELAAIFIDLFHHLHMLVWTNFFLSIASLIICMQVRFLFYEFRRRIAKHRNYIRVMGSMEARFPLATPEELQEHKKCAICWEKFESARKLPCGHFFHSSCLQSWLEQDTTCPTCRLGLAEICPDGQSNDLFDDNTYVIHGRSTTDLNSGRVSADPDRRGIVANHRNHFFHFDGSRIASWMPSFSLEVTSSHEVIMPHQTEAMAIQVQSMFPNLPLNAIIADLSLTHSIEMTTDNILQGRLNNTETNENVTNDGPVDGAENSPVLSTHNTEATVPSAENSTPKVEIQQTLSESDVASEVDRRIAPDSGEQVSDSISSESEELRRKISTGGGDSPKELQSLHARRKKEILENARRKFLEKNTLDY